MKIALVLLPDAFGRQKSQYCFGNVALMNSVVAVFTLTVFLYEKLSQVVLMNQP